MVPDTIASLNVENGNKQPCGGFTIKKNKLGLAVFALSFVMGLSLYASEKNDVVPEDYSTSFLSPAEDDLVIMKWALLEAQSHEREGLINDARKVAQAAIDRHLESSLKCFGEAWRAYKTCEHDDLYNALISLRERNGWTPIHVLGSTFGITGQVTLKN